MPVGRVGRPHGLDGSFVVEGASDAAGRFDVGAVVHVAGAPARVLVSKRARGRPVVKLDRRVEREEILAVPRAELPPLGDPDAYYVFELVGLAVEEEGGKALGRVADVLSLPANDVLELDSGLLLPLVDACVREVDLSARRVVVASGFADPA